MTTAIFTPGLLNFVKPENLANAKQLWNAVQAYGRPFLIPFLGKYANAFVSFSNPIDFVQLVAPLESELDTQFEIFPSSFIEVRVTDIGSNRLNVVLSYELRTNVTIPWTRSNYVPFAQFYAFRDGPNSVKLPSRIRIRAMQATQKLKSALAVANLPNSTDYAYALIWAMFSVLQNYASVQNQFELFIAPYKTIVTHTQTNGTPEAGNTPITTELLAAFLRTKHTDFDTFVSGFVP